MNLKNKRGIGLVALILIIVAIVVIGGIVTGVVVISKNMKKQPITADDFKYKMEKMGYTVVDVSEQFQNTYVKKGYAALAPNSEYQIEFYETDTEENAVYMFNHNKNIFETYKSASAVETTLSVENSSKYTLLTGQSYRVVSRIDDTIIYISVYKEYKNEIENVLKELGY